MDSSRKLPLNSSGESLQMLPNISKQKFSISWHSFSCFCSEVIFVKLHPTVLRILTGIEHSQKVVTRRCSVKKAFLETLQNSQKSTWPATLLKKRIWHRCFLINLAKFLRTPFLTEQIWWLLLTQIKLQLLRKI